MGVFEYRGEIRGGIQFRERMKQKQPYSSTRVLSTATISARIGDKCAIVRVVRNVRRAEKNKVFCVAVAIEMPSLISTTNSNNNHSISLRTPTRSPKIKNCH